MHKFNEFANLNSNVCIPEQRDKLPKVLFTTLSIDLDCKYSTILAYF